MTDNMSGAENPTGIEPNQTTNSLSQEVDTTTPSEQFVVHSRFVDIRSLFTRGGRQKKIEERKAKTEDDFGAEVERIAIMTHMEADIDSSTIGDHVHIHTFPWHEDLLSKYENLPDDRKKNLKREVNAFTERVIGTLATGLAADVRTLRLDQGTDKQEADEEVNNIVNPKTPNSEKRLTFQNLGKNRQMEVVQDLFELRSRLLRENADTYIYYLSSAAERGGTSQNQIDYLKKKLETSTDEERIKISAKARQAAVKAMEAVAKANIERLSEIEMSERGTVLLADAFDDEYMLASIPGKEKIIEKVIKAKVDLSLGQIHDVSRLRRLLEHDQSVEEEQFNQGDDLSDEDLLLEEVTRIEELIRDAISPTFGTSAVPLGEIDINDMRKVIDRLSKKHSDPSLIDTFDRILLLRANVGDVLNL